MITEDGAQRKRNNYKLLIDPELQKGKKKLYRLNGAILGKPPIPDPEDPRVKKTVLGVIGKNLELPVPRFKCDRFWVGDLPKRDVLITGITEQIQPLVKEHVEEIGAVHSIKFHDTLKLKTVPASVLFVRAGDGQRAVDQLNNKNINGTVINVVLDDKGDNLRFLVDPVYNKDNRRPSSDKSAASTPTNKNPPFDLFNAKSKDTPPTTPSSVQNSVSAPSPVSVPSSASLPSSQVFPFSSLKISCNSSPSMGESPSSGCFSPVLSLQTPSSLDSGVCLKPFDPLLSLRSSLIGKLGNSNTSSSLPPLPPDDCKQPLPPPPPIKDDEGIENITSDEECLVSPTSLPPVSTTIDPRLQKPLWKPIGDNETNKYEIEFEEISGDESPVMVYNTQIEIEEISSDDNEGVGPPGEAGPGSDDMDISDEDASQNDNLIELNVKPITKNFTTPYHNTMAPPMILPPIPPMPMYPPPLPPPGFFPPKPPFPPPDIFPPPQHRAMLPPVVNGYQEKSYKSFQMQEKVHRYTPTKQWKVPTANNRRERHGQNVLYRVLEQLASVLLRDYEKKVVEYAAYPVLDRFWEKERREMERLQADDDKPASDGTPGDVLNGTESTSEPYRRMLPGLTPIKESTEDMPITPRKRLMNFKIPFVRQRRDAVMIARRRLHDERDKKRKRKHHEDDKTSRSKRSRSPRYDLSDISSDEFSSEEGERDDETIEEKEVSPFGPQTPPPLIETTTEESANESDIFGSTNDDTAHTSSSSSDFEKEIMRQRVKRKPNRRLSSKSDAMDIEQIIGEQQCNILSSPHKIEEEEEVKKKEVKYPKRTLSAEKNLLELFLHSGLDKEDLLMIRLAFLRLRDDDSDIVNGIPWAYYPPVVSFEPSLKRRKTFQEELHPTGCARSEGYYKIDPQDKTKYLPHLRRGKGETSENSKEKSSGSGRGNRLNHRRVASLFTSGDISREIQQYNQLKARNKQLRFAKSTIHNWGLFALEDIPADEMVVEYIGQYVRQMVADERERRYEAQGIGSSYLFRVDYEYIIDATKSGNFARFINHCCDPNCYAKVIAIGNQKKIVIYSKRDIRCGEEITYDYKFPIEDEKIPCLCGAPHCRGTLN